MPKSKEVALRELDVAETYIEGAKAQSEQLRRWITEAQHELTLADGEIAMAQDKVRRLKLECVRLGYIEVKITTSPWERKSPETADTRFKERNLLIAGLCAQNQERKNH